jgi:phosphate-selective porin OprO/OprP
MMPRRRLRRAVAVGLACAAGVGARDARAESDEELMAIIREQQRQIDELSRKVDALDDRSQAGASTEASPPPEAAQKVAEHAPDIEVKWAPGPTFSSRDGSWSAHVLGRLLVDGAGLGDGNGAGAYHDSNATEVRSARIGVEGHFYDAWRYKLEVDFADDNLDLKDAYIDYGGELVKPAHVRVGQYKVFNSLEWPTNRLFLTFMERAAIVDAFGLTRQIGISSGVAGANWGFDAGLFGQNASDQDTNEGYALAARGHYAFLYGSEEGGHVVHLGGSVRYRNFDNDTFDNEIRYSQRPFFHTTNQRSVDTGTIADAEGDVWAGLEFLWIHGPFSLHSEAANTFLQRKHGEDDANNLWGGQLTASYFLTGEHRAYDPKGGVIDRLHVDDPLQAGGVGAWELAARGDYIDLNDQGVRGGKQLSYIAGLNWYANDYIRFLLDGTITQVFDARNSAAAVDGERNWIYGAGLRAQVDW